MVTWRVGDCKCFRPGPRCLAGNDKPRYQGPFQEILHRHNDFALKAFLGNTPCGGETRPLQIPLGGHALVDITFTPPAAGELRLDLASAKDAKVQFEDTRIFLVQ